MWLVLMIASIGMTFYGGALTIMAYGNRKYKNQDKEWWPESYPRRWR